jgi:YggT family protein
VIIIFLRNVIVAFFDILRFLIFVRIILSFFPVNPYGNAAVYQFVTFLRQLTEPVLAPFRSLIPPLRAGGGGYVDFSPIIALIVLDLIKRLVLQLIR